MPHETPETISSFIDGVLAAPEAERLKAHLSACAECAALEAKLKGASAAFRRSGVAPVPAGLAARAKAEAVPGRSTARSLVLAFAVLVLAVWVSGLALRHWMPGFFASVQSMITGAGGQMGSGK